MPIRVLARLPFVLHRCDFPPASRKIRSISQAPILLSSLAASDSSRNPSNFAQQTSIAAVLLRYGFPQSHLHGFIRKNRFLVSSSSSTDVEKCIWILLSFGFSQRSLISIICSCPRALELKFLRKYQVAFSELGFPVLSPSFVQIALEQSQEHGTGPEDLVRSVQVMKDLGFTEDTVIKILKEVPSEQISCAADIELRINLLKACGIEGDEVNKVCNLFPGFLALNFDRRLRPLFAEVEELGFSKKEMRKVLLQNPRKLLTMEMGELSRHMNLLRSLNCRLAIKEKILSKGRLAACLEAKYRIDHLWVHGLIRRDAFKILYVEPRIILYEIDDLEKKIDFLVCELGLSIQHLIEFPEYLGVNLEKQIIPRYKVIQHLKSQGGLGIDVGLKHVVRLTKLKFYNLFVKPYPECEEILKGSAMKKEDKPQHPTGMWKLFKPKKFSDSEEDVKNMKLFMEALT